MLTLAASSREIPAPESPETLLTTMLLVMSMWCQAAGSAGLNATSCPLAESVRIPPPSFAAMFPWIRFRLMVTCPVPGVRMFGSAPAGTSSPATMMPPPSSNASLKMILLSSISPLSLRPKWVIPPPYTREKFPQIQFSVTR